jgi:hypothetical protein
MNAPTVARLRRGMTAAITWAFVAGIFALGVFGIRSGLHPDAGLPSRAALVEVTGTLAGYERNRHSIGFRLRGEPRDFVYPSKAKAMDEVMAGLDAAGRRPVTAWVDAADMAGDGPLTVFALAVDGREVRSYGDVAAAWRSDQRIGLWVGIAMLGCAGAFTALLLRKPPR